MVGTQRVTASRVHDRDSKGVVELCPWIFNDILSGSYLFRDKKEIYFVEFFPIFANFLFLQIWFIEKS